MKCVCMFFSASGDVEVGLRESKGWRAHTLSFRESTLYNNVLFCVGLVHCRTGLYRFSSFRVRIFSFLFDINLYGRLGDGPLGQWEPSPPLGSALVGANKKGPVFANMQIHRREGGGNHTLLKSAESWDVISLTIKLSENGRMILSHTLKCAAADHTLAPHRPWFQIIESRQKVFLCRFNVKINLES